MDFEKIKLVIWDLDNTFWAGTISEGEIRPIPEHNELIVSLTDCGIINSVCSKNTFDVAAAKLKELNVADYFVFPSIEWTPKGQRVRNMIKTMSLRAENVLFIDDEITNLEEVKHYSPEIMVGSPEVIGKLRGFVASQERKDLSHARLNQYKLLELKDVEQKKYHNNEDFLFACNIRVNMIEDCRPELDRIHDLLWRANQLNFTKKRISTEELSDLFNNPEAQCAYVTVNDKFGNYGIVGFYALQNNRLEHFLFSCRTIGLGVEQYVYSKLGCPDLEVMGEVVNDVTDKEAPLWINQTHSDENLMSNYNADNVNCTYAKFLMKGPCDLSKTISYFKNTEMFTYEFNYVNDEKGNTVDSHNHSAFFASANELTNEQKEEILADCCFVDRGIFNGTMFTDTYDIVFLSTLPESHAGIYKKKNSDFHIAAGSWLFPFTDKTCWPGLINGTHYNSNNRFTEEYLQAFSDKYEFIGKTTPADYRNRIQKILNSIDSRTKLCLILGVEFACETNSDPEFNDRHVYHAELNAEIRNIARENPRLLIIDLNEIVLNQSDFANNMNVFSSRVYYEISQKMIEVINRVVPAKIESYTTLYIYFDILLNYTKRFAKMLISRDSYMYKNLQKIYYKLSRKKGLVVSD